MKKSSLLLIIILLIFKSYAQEKSVVILGKITSDSSSVSNIHIINKTTKKATISNYKGEFQIPVKENDTLFISAVQFESKTIFITKIHLEKLSISILLKTAINELGEVSIKKSENIAKGLGLPNADKKPLNKLENRINYHSKASMARVLLGVLLNEKGNINDIYYITSGKRKKDRKLTKLKEGDTNNIYTQQEIQKIRVHFKDSFFIETLKIPKQEINYFIKFCEAKNIIQLFNKKSTLEVIDIFIKESKVYLKKLENEE